MKPLPPVHRDGLVMAKLCATPGLCMFCEEPCATKRPRPDKYPNPSRKTWTCGSLACQRAYTNAWKRDRSMALQWERWLATRRRRAA